MSYSFANAHRSFEIMVYSSKSLHTVKKHRFPVFLRAHGEQLFYIAFCIYLATYFLYTLELKSFGVVTTAQCAQLGKIVAAVLLILKWLVQDRERKALFRLAIALPLALLSSLFSGDLNLLIILLFVASSQGIQLHRMAKYATFIEAAFFAVVVFCFLIGIIPSHEVEYRGDGTARYSLGFLHPNSCGLVIFSICLSYALYRFRSFRLYDLTIYIPALILCWFVLDSRTSFACIVLVGITAFITTRFTSRESQKRILISFIVVFLLLSLTSIFSMLFYDASNPLFTFLNRLLSNRLYLSHFYFSSVLPMPFGTNWEAIDISTGEFIGFICDNAYAHLVLQSGYITGLLFLFLYLSVFVYHFRRSHLTPESLGLFLCAILAFTESQAFHFAINYSLIGFGVLFYSIENYSLAFKSIFSDLRAGVVKVKMHLHRALKKKGSN